MGKKYKFETQEEEQYFKNIVAVATNGNHILKASFVKRSKDTITLSFSGQEVKFWIKKLGEDCYKLTVFGKSVDDKGGENKNAELFKKIAHGDLYHGCTLLSSKTHKNESILIDGSIRNEVYENKTVIIANAKLDCVDFKNCIILNVCNSTLKNVAFNDCKFENKYTTFDCCKLEHISFLNLKTDLLRLPLSCTIKNSSLIDCEIDIISINIFCDLLNISKCKIDSIHLYCKNLEIYESDICNANFKSADICCEFTKFTNLNVNCDNLCIIGCVIDTLNAEKCKYSIRSSVSNPASVNNIKTRIPKEFFIDPNTGIIVTNYEGVTNIEDYADKTVWKYAKGISKFHHFESNILIELKVPASALKTFNPPDQKNRASEAVVQCFYIIDRQDKKLEKISDPENWAVYSVYNSRFKYKIGETVKPELPFDTALNSECRSGIHFFYDIKTAINYL